MFKLNQIEHFPRIIRFTAPKELFTLHQIQKKETLANKKRECRQKKIEQEKSVELIKLKSNITQMTLEEAENKRDKISNPFDCYLINKNNNILNKCNDIIHSIDGMFKNSFYHSIYLQMKRKIMKRIIQIIFLHVFRKKNY